MSRRDTPFFGDHGRCPAPCGKTRWGTRSDAKKFIKRHHPGGDRVRAYPCGDFWHVGHAEESWKRGA